MNAIQGAKQVIQRDHPIIIYESGGRKQARNIHNTVSETVNYLCFLMTYEGLVPVDKISTENFGYNYLLVPQEKMSIINAISKVLWESKLYVAIPIAVLGDFVDLLYQFSPSVEC